MIIKELTDSIKLMPNVRAARDINGLTKGKIYPLLDLVGRLVTILDEIYAVSHDISLFDCNGSFPEEKLVIITLDGHFDGSIDLIFKGELLS